MSPEELLWLADAAEAALAFFNGSREAQDSFIVESKAQFDRDFEAFTEAGFAFTAGGIALARRVARVEMAGRTLLSKMDEVHDDPRQKSVWLMAKIHGNEYDGPSYEVELAALRQALDHEEGDEK